MWMYKVDAEFPPKTLSAEPFDLKQLDPATHDNYLNTNNLFNNIITHLSFLSSWLIVI